MLTRKQAILSDVKAAGDRSFTATLYDASELDRDGETIDLGSTTAREPVTLQADHDRSVLKTLGKVTSIRAAGQRLRGRVTFAPPGISDVADQVFRQVDAGVTSSVSIGFTGRAERAEEGYRIWRDVEVLELSFVSVPSSAGAGVDRAALKRWLRGGPLDHLGPHDLVELPPADDGDELIELPEYDPVVLELAPETLAETIARQVREVLAYHRGRI